MFLFFVNRFPSVDSCFYLMNCKKVACRQRSRLPNFHLDDLPKLSRNQTLPCIPITKKTSKNPGKTPHVFPSHPDSKDACPVTGGLVVLPVAWCMVTGVIPQDLEEAEGSKN